MTTDLNKLGPPTQWRNYGQNNNLTKLWECLINAAGFSGKCRKGNTKYLWF